MQYEVWKNNHEDTLMVACQLSGISKEELEIEVVRTQCAKRILCEMTKEELEQKIKNIIYSGEMTGFASQREIQHSLFSFLVSVLNEEDNEHLPEKINPDMALWLISSKPSNKRSMALFNINGNPALQQLLFRSISGHERLKNPAFGLKCLNNLAHHFSESLIKKLNDEKGFQEIDKKEFHNLLTRSGNEWSIGVLTLVLDLIEENIREPIFDGVSDADNIALKDLVIATLDVPKKMKILIERFNGNEEYRSRVIRVIRNEKNGKALLEYEDIAYTLLSQGVNPECCSEKLFKVATGRKGAAYSAWLSKLEEKDAWQLPFILPSFFKNRKQGAMTYMTKAPSWQQPYILEVMAKQ